MGTIAKRPAFHLPQLPGGRKTYIALSVIGGLAVLAAAVFTFSQLSGSARPPVALVPVSPSPSASPSLEPSPTPTATPSATPAATPTPSVVATLNCRIAISNGSPGSGGWLTFPAGTFQADPSSDVRSPDPYGGRYGLTHVLALNRWVPVPRDWVRTDGRVYTYWSYYYWSVEAVDAGNNVAHLGYPTGGAASMPRVGSGFHVVAAESDGVYVAADWGMPGLWRLSYSGGSTLIATDGYWQAVGGGAAYGTVTQSVPAGAANTIFRQDLSSGRRADFFTTQGFSSRVVGFSAGGDPVIEARAQTSVRVWLAPVGGRPVQLASIALDEHGQAIVQGGGGGGGGMYGPGMGGQVFSVVGDSRGLWVALPDGLYLYSATAGLEKASTATGQLASSCR